MRQVSQQSSWVHGCSCVGVFGVCMCGFVDQSMPLRPGQTMPHMRGAGPSPLPQSPPSCASDELVALLLSLCAVCFGQRSRKKVSTRPGYCFGLGVQLGPAALPGHCVARSSIDLTMPPTSPNAASAAEPDALLPRSSSGLTSHQLLRCLHHGASVQMRSGPACLPTGPL